MSIPATDVIFSPAGAGAVNRTVQDKLLEIINVKDYGAVGDGVADDTDAFRDAIAEAAGRPVYVPAGEYIITEQIQVLSTDTVGLSGPGLHLIGDGMVATIINNHCTDESLFYLDAAVTSPAVHAQMGVCVEKLAVLRDDFPASDSSAFEIHNCYQARFDQVMIRNQGAHGIHMLNGDIPDDGWNMVSLNNVWIEACQGWGIKADGASSRNEGSFTVCRNVFLQGNGLNEYVAVTAITNATTGVVTAAGHGFANGEKIKIFGVEGMTEVNGQTFTATVIDANTFSIGDTSGYGAYTSGGETAPQIPGSGGMIWKGQLLQMQSCAFTLNQNVGFFAKGQAGLGVGVSCDQVTWENNLRRHVYVTGIDNWHSSVCQFHGNSLFKTHVGVEYDASDFSIRSVVWDGTVVRANQGSGAQWKITGANVVANSCRVYRTSWQDFDYPGQRRFEGWKFDQVDENCVLRWAAANAITFGPNNALGEGVTTPMRLRGPSAQTVTVPPAIASTTGEWIPYFILSTGVVKLNTGLAANTLFNVYLYDANGAAALELDSAVGYQIDAESGYRVKVGDATKRWVGRVRTDGSSNFINGNSGFLEPTPIAGGQQGTADALWHDTAGRRLWLKSGALPTTATDGDYALWATFEASSLSYSPPSLAAGASATTTISATCALGDYVTAASFSQNQAGVTLQAWVSAANTLTVQLTNTTGSTVALATGDLRVLYQRR